MFVKTQAAELMHAHVESMVTVVSQQGPLVPPVWRRDDAPPPSTPG